MGQSLSIDGASKASAVPSLTGHQVLREAEGMAEVEKLLLERRALRADLKRIQRGAPWQNAREIRVRLKFLQGKIYDIVASKVQLKLI